MKERLESEELRVYKSLDPRKKLTPKEKYYFAGLEKGFIGEKLFDQWLEPVLENRILLPDMQFMPSTTFVQIDTLLLTSKQLYLFEVKYYEGDHVIEGDNLLRMDGTDAKNPLLQLKRNEPVLRRILDNVGCSLPIQPIAVFVNPRFHLYNAPVGLPIIYPAQLERFIAKLNQTPSFLKRTHTDLAEKLIFSTVADNPYVRLPDYRYSELRKGIVCPGCGRFYNGYSRAVLVCSFCGGNETAHSAVLRTIEEFKLLFPDVRITVSQIHDWCKIVKGKKTVRKILEEEYLLKNQGRSSFYIEK
ncbi:NERD domain-containing protein [Bacillus salacetis]|uniref:NERD domain-containing protein n=1 Tax=Bacillus salacetis TaxID=2315464 RepID=A0A3A1QUX6_9BACI|nr:nuclease-related domain-containing protein [Bacillus salacetis]RIW29619.1 NERD domain-containing protein [Bacillus salacetis]